MAYQFKEPIPVQGVKALVANNRLEARPRSQEFNRSLRAEIRDPAWLLARQWQMKEFKAEDRGSPAFAEVEMAQRAVNRISFSGQAPIAYDLKQNPLEAAVESQPVPVGQGLRLQLGQHWRQLLRTLQLQVEEFEGYSALFYRNFKLESKKAGDSRVAYAQERTTAEVHELLQVAGEHAIDGYKLYLALLQTDSSKLNSVITNAKEFKSLIMDLPLYKNLLTLPGFNKDNPGVDLNAAGIVNKLNNLSQQFVLTFYRLYFHSAALSGWSVMNMAYGFSLMTETGPKEPVVLGIDEHPSGDLHWYSVDQQAVAHIAGPQTAIPIVTKRFLPTEIQFPGSPNARWWEFEDRRVDFGALTGDPSDFGRMLLQEFMFLYQNDWFSLPFDVPVGMFCTIKSLKVTDVFGTTYNLQPAGAGQIKEQDTAGKDIDNDAGRWRLFNQTDLNGSQASPHLFVPPTVVVPLVGKPVEQVGFRREEATNLVWAIEQTIPNGFMRGMDGNGAAAQVAEYLRVISIPDAQPAGPHYIYQPINQVAENWIPFVLTKYEDVYYLEQAEMQRHITNLAEFDKVVKPLTSLILQLPDKPYLVHEHKIPPSGLCIDSAFRRARWFNGQTILWFGYSQGSALAGGSSGLTFDQLIINNSNT